MMGTCSSLGKGKEKGGGYGAHQHNEGYLPGDFGVLAVFPMAATTAFTSSSMSALVSGTLAGGPLGGSVGLRFPSSAMAGARMVRIFLYFLVFQHELT